MTLLDLVDPAQNRCAACNKPEGRLVYVLCGECGHPYLTPWGIVWHDQKERWRDYCFCRERCGYPFNLRWALRALIPRRRKSIFACPCCAHDL